MRTNYSSYIRNILLGMILIGIVLFLGPIVDNNLPNIDAPAVTVSQPDTYSNASTLTYPNETLILPADKVEQQAGYLPKSRSTRDYIPGDYYELGCSATSGVFISGGLDRGGTFQLVSTNRQDNYSVSSTIVWVNMNSYPNLYTGPTNGGVMPSDNSSWPTWTDIAGATFPNNPLLASHMGVDGRLTRGTIDDYWVSYESTASDPYITGSWTQHAWGDAIGDYMYTSQSEFDNVDGSTQFYSNPVHPAGTYTCEMMSSNSEPDGTLGIKQFYQARGYAVGTCYNQQTDNKIAGGFSFTQFKAEIDAGWPVLLGLDGHSVVGVGYDSAAHLIYIFNGWDNDIHAMSWPDNCYDGHCSVSYNYPDTTPYTYVMALQSVSIVHIVPGASKLYTITGNAGVPNATLAYTGGYTIADSNGNYSFTVSENWFGTVKPSKAGYTFTPAEKAYANVKANVVAQNYNSANLIQDPGFELGSPNPYWIEATTPLYQLLCSASSCGAGARTGSSWAWFGGVAVNETGSLSQTVTIPTGSASLDFYLWIRDAPTGSDANDIFAVKVDGMTVFTANPTQLEYYYSNYRPINVNLSAYADGKPHKIEFSSVTTVQAVSFHLDDVFLNSTPMTVPPDSFNKASPPNGAINLPTTPTLSWSDSANITSYQYCYDFTDDNACSNWMDNGNSTSVTLTGLEPGTTYYWHARAVNNYGETYSNGSNTAFWSFTTIPQVVIPTPVPSETLPVMKSQALTPSSLTTQLGTTSGSLSSLSLLDQTGANDNPAAYVSFQTPNGVYVGYQSFFLPQEAQTKLVSTMLLQINFKGSVSPTQVWTWSIYDPTSDLWIEVGNSLATAAGQWQSLTFRIEQPWRYVSAGREIRIQLRSNNADGDAKIDYEALHITYLSIPVIPVAPVNTSNRPGISSAPNIVPTATPKP